jgi:ubiquitin-like modifier-activating enzyme ATG7
MIKNFNTVEEFKKADRNKMLHNAANAVGKHDALDVGLS